MTRIAMKADSETHRSARTRRSVSRRCATTAATAAAVALAWAGLGVADAGAALLPASVFSGSTATFDYEGGSDNGLFGQPLVSNGGFVFTPSNFVATASDGGATTTGDRLEITLTADDGQFIQGIDLNEIGDYSILGTGTVNAAGFLFGFYDDGDGYAFTPITTQLDTDPDFPFTGTDTQGFWTGEGTLTFPAGTTEVRLVLNNTLQAAATAGSTATIEKKGVGIEIGVIVPEPASLGLLGLGSLTLIRRRR